MAGRPKLTDPRDHSYRVRLNDEEWKELEYIKKNSKNFKLSKFLRSAIHEEYERLN